MQWIPNYDVAPTYHFLIQIQAVTVIPDYLVVAIVVPVPVHVLRPALPETASETTTTHTVMSVVVIREEMEALTIARDRSPHVATTPQQQHEVLAGVLHPVEAETNFTKQSQ